MSVHSETPTPSVAHHSIELVEAECTSCMVCARVCPTWCIDLSSHPEPDASQPAGARVRTVNILDEFILDWSLCMFCGQCVDECPFHALVWSDRPVAAQRSRAGLVSGREDLRKRPHT